MAYNFEFYAPTKVIQWTLQNVKHVGKQHPICPEKLHNLPVSCPSQAIFLYQTELCAKTSHIFKPDFMLHPSEI